MPPAHIRVEDSVRLLLKPRPLFHLPLGPPGTRYLVWTVPAALPGHYYPEVKSENTEITSLLDLDTVYRHFCGPPLPDYGKWLQT